MLASFLVMKIVFLLLLYLFLLLTVGLIYRDLALAAAGDEKKKQSSVREAPSASLFRLVILESPGKQKGDFFKLNRSLTIGRDSSCDIVLKDRAVSARHARIDKQGDQFFLEDLGSSNGTFVGNEQISEQVSLKAGDRIRIGQTLLELVG